MLLVILWQLRYKLSRRDLAELFLERGFVFTHGAFREWEASFAPLIADQLRAKRCGQAGSSWHVDEISIKVHGKWYYLYRAIDWDENLINSRLGETRDLDVTKRLFKQAIDVVDHASEQVTMDGHNSYPCVIP